ILEGLEKNKRKYDEKVKAIKKKIENGEPPSCPPYIEGIFNLVQQLYDLPNIGQYLQNVKKEEKRISKYREKHYKVSRNQNDKLTQNRFKKSYEWGVTFLLTVIVMVTI
ncbi:4539_t:CDS:2, partial [Cetraspora pellucida]